jgi:hypothetical protein
MQHLKGCRKGVKRFGSRNGAATMITVGHKSTVSSKDVCTAPRILVHGKNVLLYSQEEYLAS